MKRLATIIIIAVLATGCRYDIDEILLVREDISFTIKDEEIFVFNPLTCQISCSRPENIYRMYDDRLSDWVMMECAERPDTEGQIVKADLTWTASSSIRIERGLKFTVQKTSPDGKVWLWNKSKKIGIVIKNL
ncbi:MAG: hypothetical protein J6R30_04060 [Bacteroidales bacterium]|jgi:hypothetical protein|nr:hypothetical protein [Bacteroidales bacterium]